MFTEKIKMCLYTSPGIFTSPYRLLLRYLDVLILPFPCPQNFCLETLFSLNPLESVFSIELPQLKQLTSKTCKNIK